MRVSIAPNVFRDFNSQFKVVLLSLDGIDNKSRVKESLHLLHDMERMIQLTFHKNTKKNSALLQPWIMAQQEFGRKAKHYQTSLERLLSNVLKGKTMYAHDSVTNLVRYFSLKYLVPMGVDDAAKTYGNVTFSLGTGTEKIGLFRVLKKGALYYHDEKNMLGMKLDYSRSSKTILKSTTTKALIHIDVLPPVTDRRVKEMIAEMQSLFSGFCGGNVNVLVLSAKRRSGVI